MDNVDALVQVPDGEQILTSSQVDSFYVLAQLEEQRALEVPKYPGEKTRSVSRYLGVRWSDGQLKRSTDYGYEGQSSSEFWEDLGVDGNVLTHFLLETPGVYPFEIKSWFRKSLLSQIPSACDSY